MKYFTILGKHANFSIRSDGSNAVITIYQKETSLGCLRPILQIYGIKKTIQREDEDHDLFHADDFSKDLNHVHIPFNNWSEKLFEGFLKFLGSYDLLDQNEIPLFLDAYKKANTFDKFDFTNVKSYQEEQNEKEELIISDLTDKCSSIIKEIEEKDWDVRPLSGKKLIYENNGKKCSKRIPENVSRIHVLANQIITDKSLNLRGKKAKFQEIKNILNKLQTPDHTVLAFNKFKGRAQDTQNYYKGLHETLSSPTHLKK